ncbi:MAG: DUF58 domain-containing protein [Candidatus Woesearchaeota archaeon]
MGRFPIEVGSLGKQIEILSKKAINFVTPTPGEGFFTLFRGSGLEFKDFKEYSPSEDAKHIDWKASLRSDKLLIREYLQERGMDVIFIYDVSNSMLFGSQKKIKAHYGAEFILTIAATVSEMGYNIGLICFNDKIKTILSPKASKTQFNLFFKILGDHATYGEGFDITKALDILEGEYAEGSVIFLVSDFLGFDTLPEALEKKFKKIALKYDLISVILRDPRDETLPSDNMDILISSPYDNRETILNVKQVKKEYEEYNKIQKEKLKKFLKEINSDCLELYTDKPFINPTISFFKRRNSLSK